MLPTKNRTISVSRLIASGEKRIFSNVITWLAVYINQSTEEIGAGYENAPSFYAHKMMTEWNHAEIGIGDRVTDNLGNSFDIRGKSVHSSMVWTQHQYILTQAVL